MCNLYSQTANHGAMRQLFKVDADRSDLGNMPALTAIYRKYTSPIVTTDAGQRRLVRSHWGYLTPNKSKKSGDWLRPSAWNNTRDDKIRTAPLWRHSFEHCRCLVPATGYAEATGRNPATYHWFNTKDADAFAFAGIWKVQMGMVGDTLMDGTVHSIVTTSPNDLTKAYHHRMPVILAASDYETWLTASPDAAYNLLRPFPADQMRTVSEGIGLREGP